MAINKNAEIKQLHTISDKIADRITSIAGSMPFLLLNAVWFTSWLLVNTGQFGDHLIFDKFPFGLLTTSVSLEAIVLSTFVLISQRRDAKLAELRSELDYRADLQTEVDSKTILAILERLAKNQGVDVAELLDNPQPEGQKPSTHSPDKA